MRLGTFAALLIAATAGGCTPGVGQHTSGGGGGAGASGPATSTSGAAPQSASSGECVPTCEQKECGDNGCNGSCGNCEGGAPCSPHGFCCTSTWTATFSTNGERVLPSGDRVYAAAFNGDVRMYACDGTPLAQNPTHVAATPNTLVADASGAIFSAAGLIDADSMVSRYLWSFDPDSLAFGEAPVVGLSNENFWDGTMIGNELWMVGERDVSLSEAHPVIWRIPPAAPTEACSGLLDATANSVSRAIVGDGSGGAYVAITNPAAILRVTCATGCECTTVPLVSGFPSGFTARGLALVGRDLYVAGFGPSSGAVYRVTLPDGLIAGSYVYDVTGGLEGFEAVVANGTMVVAVGADSLTDTTHFSDGRGIVVSLPAGFGIGALATVETRLPGTNLIWTAALDGNALYLAGQHLYDPANGEQGFVMLCSSPDACPAL